MSALRSAAWLRIDRRELPPADLGLDAGETAAILLAEALGVLVQERERGALPALRPVLDALVAQGFRISPALLGEALPRVGEG